RQLQIAARPRYATGCSAPERHEKAVWRKNSRSKPGKDAFASKHAPVGRPHPRQSIFPRPAERIARRASVQGPWVFQHIARNEVSRAKFRVIWVHWGTFHPERALVIGISIAGGPACTTGGSS